MGFKDAKLNFLVDIATDLFMCRSIQDVTIKDIAITAQVGEATIYRYFSKKQGLVLYAAMKILDDVQSNYFKLEKEMNGYQKIEVFYLSYLEIFKDHPNYYKFLREFDLYMSEEKGDALGSYEAIIEQYNNAYLKAYEEGIKDGSVKEQKDINLFYFSTTHAVIELCKKLSLKEVLHQDFTIEKFGEIKYLIDLILNTLKNA